MASRISPETAKAVAGLFREEASGLFGYALTLPGVSRCDAEDLVQVTFHAAAKAWERKLCPLDEECRRKWLYRVLRNKAIDQWRNDRSRSVLGGPIKETPGPPQETHEHALCSIALQRCWDRIEKMPRVRQRVAFLRWGEDWSSAEIAEFLGISSSTVRAHLKLARDELAVEIKPDLPFAQTDDDTDEGVA